MAKIREEIVGKRFLCVSKSSKLKLNKISEWDWRAGVIRACTHTDSKHPDLQVLVEYDDVSWQRREWVHVYRDKAFQLLLLEHTLVWAAHKIGSRQRTTLSAVWPVLVFEPLIDEVGLRQAKERPVEHLLDRSLEFQDYELLQQYQDEVPANCDPDCEECVRSWVAEQDGQRILCTTPSVLVGFRVQVYRSEGTTQWYTAVIVGYNDTTRELTVTDDTVLEEHSENPSLVHIRLLGEGVVESILRGENVGITPRRSRSASNNHHQQTGVRHIRRDPFPSRGRKTSLSKSSNPSTSPSEVLSPPSPLRPLSPSSPVILNLPGKLLNSRFVPQGPETPECSSPDRGSADEVSSVDSVTPPFQTSSKSPPFGSDSSKNSSDFLVLQSKATPPPSSSSSSSSSDHLPQPDTPPSDKGENHLCGRPSSPRSDQPLADSVDQRSSSSSIGSSETNRSQCRATNSLSSESRKDCPGISASSGEESLLQQSDQISASSKGFAEEESQSISQINNPDFSNNIVKTPKTNKDKVDYSQLPEAKVVLYPVKCDSVLSLNKSEFFSQKEFKKCSVSSESLKKDKDRRTSLKGIKDSPSTFQSGFIKIPVDEKSEEIPDEEPQPRVSSPNSDKRDKSPIPELQINKILVEEYSNSKKELAKNNNGIIKSPQLVKTSTSSFSAACDLSVPDLKKEEETAKCSSPTLIVLDETHKKVEGQSDRCASKNVFESAVRTIPSPSVSSDKSRSLNSSPSEGSTNKNRLSENLLNEVINLSELSCKTVERASLAVSNSNYNINSGAESNVSSNSLTIFSVSPVADSSKAKVPISGAVSTPILSAQPAENRNSGSFGGSNSPFAGLVQNLAVAGAVGGRAVTITATSGPAPQGTSRVASPPSVSITAVVRSPGSQQTQHQEPNLPFQDGAQATHLQLLAHQNLTSGSSTSSALQQCSTGSNNSSSRMDQCDGSSDSGVSVTERSQSRSSVLSDDRSSSAEVKPNTPTPTPVLAPTHSKTSQSQPLTTLDRKDQAKVWRNPAVLSDLSVRHIHSLQHSMSQHFSGVPPHVAPPPSTVAGHHSSSHPQHGPPPPSATAATGIPPHVLPHSGLSYPSHPGSHHPLHIPGLQPPIGAAAAAGLYPVDVWKQLNVPPLQHYGLLPTARQDEFNLIENERIQRERREREAEKAKMERERVRKEIERRDKDERIRRGEVVEKSHLHHPLVNQHFEETFLYLANKQKPPNWNQGLSNIPVKNEVRDHRQISLPQTSHTSHSDNIRKGKEPEQLVRDGIWKALRLGDHQNPPPAHTRTFNEKSLPPSLSGYPQYTSKEPKPNQERSPYIMSIDKPSVIVKPESPYDKVSTHSVSPKPRIPGRSSPYSSNTTGPNPYKPYEHPTASHRGNTPHHQVSNSSSSLSVELGKARAQASPHSVPSSCHVDRYFNSGTKPPVTNPYQSSLHVVNHPPNHLHHSSLPPKPKVASPPTPIYCKPGITSGTPVCKIDTRPTQAISLPSKASANLSGGQPPPAHSGFKSHETRLPSTLQDRIPNHSPLDARLYPVAGSTHPKSIPGSVPTHQIQRVVPPTSISHHPTQTQPLDLNIKDNGTSPNRRRPQTPTPPENKKPRLETTPLPLLSRVSEPSPLFPTAATTITTVENTAALENLKRVSSPVQNLVSSSHQSSPTKPNSPFNISPVSMSNDIDYKQTVVQPPPPSTTPISSREDSGSPGLSKLEEPEKSNSPIPIEAAGGYVHKLKKAWLQRHRNGPEAPISSPTSFSGRVSTPPPRPSSPGVKTNLPPTTSSGKQDLKNIRKAPSKATPLPNGHIEDSREADTTTSDSEDSLPHKPKRPKIKRPLSNKKSSDSNSDSDKESDGSESSVKKQERNSKSDSEPRRRGRRPKSKVDKDNLPKIKKVKDDISQNYPLHKPPISHLKKTGESFLQYGDCYQVAPKLPKCRECRRTAHQKNKKMSNIQTYSIHFCRFYAFRRLRYTKSGQLAVAGFTDPVKDDDLRLWVPDPLSPAADLDKDKSIFLLTHVGDQFCDLVQQEKEAMALHIGEDNTAWKRVVQEVREICDVCETTLFNIHWACSKCGFVVCIDCYKSRKEGTVKMWDVEDGVKERDKYSWLLCASRVPHEQDKLMLTQIIAGTALSDLGSSIHELRHRWGIPMYCGCPETNRYKEMEQEDKKRNGISKDIKKEIKNELVNGSVKVEKNETMNNGKDEDMSNSPLNFFADVALSNDKRESEASNSDSDSDSDDKGQSSTLRELLVRPNCKGGSASKEDSANKAKEPSRKKTKLDTLDDVISCVIERGIDKDDKKDLMKVELKHFIRKYNYKRKGREPLPIRIMTKTESRLLYPNIPHSWLCSGKLLRLHDPLHKDNLKVFQDQWKRGQPVIVSGTGHNLNSELWRPSTFSKDFGEIKNNLINCLTDNIVPNQPMKKFWDGFEHYNKRLKDDKGQPMILKLKDWPPGEDFAEILPKRFEDLMKVLPMGDYTRRNGCLNLACRLPECFVRPDLGPKMYIAYGSASNPHKASTNLHLDISDAVNVMCYVGIPKDVSTEDYIKDSLKAIDEAGCDVLTCQRVREKDELPGALWHIYHARDADKIRDLLNKVAIERGKKLEPHHDPIHDQSWYLDGGLRDRLYKEYGVEGYAIVQCMGDAVFIPAGAPHQVRNLQDCIKVAEDFVSPENVAHCFHLTQEFRHLSDTHTNHEDKLQIKNMIYHAVKDSLAYLMASEQNGVKKERDS